MKTADHLPRWQWDDRLELPRGSVENIFFAGEAWQQAQRGLLTETQLWGKVGGELGLDPEDLSAFRYDFFAGDELDRSLIRLIRSLRKKGYLIGLLSNNGPALRAEIKALRILEFFDQVAISAEMGVMKPEQTIYRKMEGAMGVASSEMLLIDDAAENVRGARKAGWQAIYYSPELDLENELSVFFDI